jgi:redox-sensing transcriptional repressor
MPDKSMVTKRTVERFFRYCQFLRSRAEEGVDFVFSRELAAAVGVSPEQVRRDLMNFRLKGTPQKGYRIEEFIAELYSHLEASARTNIVLVGVGNLGRAILSYFNKRRPNLSIVAAFDQDPEMTDRVVAGCHVYHISQMEKIVREQKALVGIITVPAQAAQEAANLLVKAGIRGVLNFAPTGIKLQPEIFLENIDITLSIEKVVYFARQRKTMKEQKK